MSKQRDHEQFDGDGALVSTAWLSRHSADRDLVIVDASVSKAIDTGGGRIWRSGRADFEMTGHIAGARFADLIVDFSKFDGLFAFTRPGAARFAAAAGAIGLSNRSRIVVYDNSTGIWAARLWWLMRAFGHDRVAVLDGGLTAWVAEGRPLERGPVTTDASMFVAREQPGFFVDTTEIVALVDSRVPGLLVCVLRPPVFTGAEQNYARPGHIPGSLNFPYEELLDFDNRFLGADKLRSRLAPLIEHGNPIIVYCGGGVTAAATALALTLIGARNVAVYDGSLAEWSADPKLPMSSSAASELVKKNTWP